MGVTMGVTMAIGMAVSPLHAQGTSIVGSWRGNGKAVETDGTTYRVRCKMSINVDKGRVYRLRGKCTSSKGVTEGEGSIKKIAANSYAGSIEGLNNGDVGRIAISAGKSGLSVRLKGSRGRLTAALRKSGN